MNECTKSCRATERDMPTCEIYCGCVLDGLKAENLLTLGNRLDEAQRSRWLGIVDQCQPKAEPPATGQ
jgi:hypothetical protein